MNRLVLTLGLVAVFAAHAAAGPKVDVVVAKDASRLEKLAGRELGSLLKTLFDAEVTTHSALPKTSEHLLVVGNVTSPLVKRVAGDKLPTLTEQGHFLRSIERDGRTVLLVSGGSGVATLWAAYELGHHFGMRYFLHGDVPPIETPTLKLTGIDTVLEPTLAVRCWELLGPSPVGSTSWGLPEHRKALRQLAKLKFNRVTLRFGPSQPFVGYQVGKAKKTSSELWPGGALPVDGDTPGRKAFGGAKVFDNPALRGKTKPDERIEAGIALARGIIALAREVGLQTEVAFAPLEFPKEVADAIEGDEQTGLVLTKHRNYANTYPRADALRLTGEEVWAEPRPAKPTIRIEVGSGYTKKLGHDTILSIGRSAKRVLDEFEKTATKRDILRIPLDDGGRGLLPQLSTGSVDSLVRLLRKRKWKGYSVMCSLPGDSGPAIYYLSRAGFDAKVTPKSAYHDLITPILGEGVSDRVIQGFDMIEKASDLVNQNDPTFTEPTKSVVMKHDKKGDVPKWWGEARDLYIGAMNEMYRGIRRSRGGARDILLYHAKKLEFAMHYFNCVEAVRLAGQAKGDDRLEQIEKATEAIYNGLTALGDAARDSSDRAIIAVLSNHGYKPLSKLLDE